MHSLEYKEDGSVSMTVTEDTGKLEGHFGIVPGNLVLGIIAPKTRKGIHYALNGSMMKPGDTLRFENGILFKEAERSQQVATMITAEKPHREVSALFKDINQMYPDTEFLEWRHDVHDVIPHRDDFLLLDEFAFMFDRFNQRTVIGKTTYRADSPYHGGQSDGNTIGFLAEFAAQTSAVQLLEPQDPKSRRLPLLTGTKTDIYCDLAHVSEGDQLECITLGQPQADSPKSFSGEAAVVRINNTIRELIGYFSFDGNVVSARVARRMGLRLPDDF